MAPVVRITEPDTRMIGSMMPDRLRTIVQPHDDVDVRHLLGSRRRRDIVGYLLEDESIAFNELVDRIATRERELASVRSDVDHRVSVYASLYLTHIPKLVDAGVVAYDPDTRRVTITDRGLRLRSQLRAPRTDRTVWSLVFLVQSVVWILIILAAWIGVPPLAGVPAAWLIGSCVGTQFATSLAYACRTSRSPIGHGYAR
ncbi:MAG: DUF7344 domain-containing protein [Halobacteriota archaeon]|uniref:DUF7344 domain-containing protein n=1 Tax=Natronomonas sp. TaxID=2184060 RepID=UPI003975B6EC